MVLYYNLPKMGKYVCSRCGKDFKQKSHYESHQNRKKMCENILGRIKELVNQAIQERVENNNSIDNTLNQLKNILEHAEMNENEDDTHIMATPIENTIQLLSNESNKPSSETNHIVDKITQPTDIMAVLDQVLETKTYNDIANYMNVAVGTVKRWKELNSVPPAYQFDLMKYNNVSIDYSQFSYKEKDQFFTPVETAKYCFKVFQNFLRDNNDSDIGYTYIEPSAGDGSFLKVLPAYRTFAVDIEPKAANIQTSDYLTWYPPKDNKYIVFGNPPFGLRGQLALKFINHSAQFADYVCFILPQLFESDGKGVPRKRVKGYNLVHSEKLDTNFYEPNQKEIKINCIFQIWAKNYISDKYTIQSIDNEDVKIYSLSNGGTPSTTRNKDMFYKCDMYIPSTCFGKDNMKYYATFDELPHQKGYGIVFNKNKEEYIEKSKNIIWSDVAFLSTNSAYNIRSSQIMEQFTQ